MVARNLARGQEPAAEGAVAPAADREPEAEVVASAGTSRTAVLILPIAGLVGFIFFLMELVWYRMLAPVLGGSSYTFGSILTLALLGIGAGGLLYAGGSRARRPTCRR